MRYFYICDLVKHGIVNVKWHPGQENLADYESKHRTLCTILKFVAASAAEAKLGAMFLNAKEAKMIRLTLEEPDDKRPIRPNGPILTSCTILKFVAAIH